MPDDARRAFFFDDNARGVGGHFLELATLLAHGARAHGLNPVLIANRRFNDFASCDFPVHAVFRPHRMVRWSLGVDGKSKTIRSIDGSPDSGSIRQNLRQRFRDLLKWRVQRPSVMINDYAAVVAGEIRDQHIDENDLIVINTCDDFALTGLAKAIRIAQPNSPLQIHAVFHFAATNGPPAIQFGRQVNRAADTLSKHNLHLHATSPQLARQMTDSGITLPVTAIPYPTRRCQVRSVDQLQTKTGRRRVVLAGLPRAEKGRDAIHAMVEDVADQLNDEAGICLSMQMNENGWQKMIPESLHDEYQRCDQPNPGETPLHPFEIMTSNLESDVYHCWLDSADMGLFLYEPSRYAARVSGVLLEMMTRGVPVIVPGDCWLGDFVHEQNERLATNGFEFPCGLIYSDRSEIAGLIRRMNAGYVDHARAARSAADGIAQAHSGAQTIAEMEWILMSIQIFALRQPQRRDERNRTQSNENETDQ